jgi:hypothetical protein
LQLAFEIGQFLELFPTGPHAADARAMLDRLRTVLNSQFRQQADKAGQLLSQRKVGEAVGIVRALETLATSPEEKLLLSTVNQGIAKLKKELVEELVRLGPLRKKMITVDDIIDVRRAAGLLAMLDPDHAEAATLLADAQKKGRTQAEAFLKKAKSYKNGAPDLYQETLRKAYWLDPDGEFGRQAATQLNEK